MSRTRLSLLPGLGRGWRRVRLPLALLLVGAAVNVTALFVVTLPSWRQARASGAAVRMNQQAQEIVEPALVRARGMYGPVRGAEQALAELRDRVAARSGSVSEVVATVRAAIDASGLRVERIAYEPQPVDELGLTRMQITLPVRGQYAQLRAFLDGLLDGPVFAVVERIAASTPGSADASGALLMNVVLSAFVDGTLAAAPRANVPGEAPVSPSLPPVTMATDPVQLARTLRQRLMALPDIPLPADAFHLRLPRLDERYRRSEASRRNLFAFASLPSAARSPEDEAAGARRAQRREPAAPVNPYDLLGVIRTRRGLLATIADDTRVFNVAAGDVLPAGYRVTEVGMVDVWLEAGGRRIRLSLRKDRDDHVGEPASRGADAPAENKRRKKKKQDS